MRVLMMKVALWFLLLIRLPWTVYRFFKAYSYACYIDRRVTHNGKVTLSLESGESISYMRGSGINLFKFIGAFIDRR
jgi:hypothetical protein